VNLVPDKTAVFNDAFRVLRPGGRLSLSDIVLLGEVPLALRDSVEAYVACLSGAIMLGDYLRLLCEAGFADVAVTSERRFDAEDILAQDLIADLAQHGGVSEEEVREAATRFASVRVSARKQSNTELTA